MNLSGKGRMSEKYKTFDAATATLQRGVSVVEASAGTGKTYAIAILVLRFVVEFDVALEKLLVVSYTRAATEELRSRIRERLVEARRILAGRVPEKEDPVLLSYLSGLTDKSQAARRLDLALLEMDRAAIYTIHGFCQRMLQEQALESGQLFDMELTADITGIKEELLADFWRSTLYDLPLFHCSLFLSSFATPDALYETVRAVAPEDVIEPALSMELQDALAEMDETLESLRNWWQRHAMELKQCLEDAVCRKMFKIEFIEFFAQWWAQLEQFFSREGQPLPPKLELLGEQALLAWLNGKKLRGAKKAAFLEDFPLPGGELSDFTEACKTAVLLLRITLARSLQIDLRERLIRQGRFSFDDLVLSLARALDGSRGGVLRQALSRRFKVALIDEFQDTDAAQYRIFSSLFGGREKRHFLFLIGDPKQAIYKFRGADIAAYFQARESADYLLGLERNYRSNPRLVEAVNQLFLHREGAGSFVTSQLSYVRVAAAKTEEEWRMLQQGTARAAMVYCSLDSPDESGKKPKLWTSGKIRERLERFVVAEIGDLLGDAELQMDDAQQRELRPGDIAILVRSNKQAESFQQSLALAGIPAVVISRKTVFETGEAVELRRVAEAVAFPSDTSLLRLAMSSRWFGMDAGELYRSFSDEVEMDGWLERFQEYHELWKEKGFLAMMNTLIAEEAVLEHLCAFPLAERQIANIQHLMELLQEKENNENLHYFQTLQYLSAQIQNPEGYEAAQLRLESDEQAVKVVTMHAVKGLEYPVVFCPYLWYRPGFLRKEKHCVFSHDEDNRRVADLGSDRFAARREMALEEELAEEVRLLYVAVTRASSCCYVFWADVQGNQYVAPSRESALAWVLSLDGCVDIREQNDRLRAFCDRDFVELRTVESTGGGSSGREVREEDDVSVLHCRDFSRSALSSEWLMTSYSALAASSHMFLPKSSIAVTGVKGDLLAEQVYPLPLGAAFGNVVHGLLEDYPFSMLASDDDYAEACQKQCRRFGVTAESFWLMKLLRDVTNVQLLPAGGDSRGGCLADLDGKDVLKEMPFYFHLRPGSTGELNRLLSFSPVVRAVPERSLGGYLTGFIDLVCRYQGKYYIMDYKTNYLGSSLADYSPEALQTAMHAHNYGLQYWIYSLVLHRFLKGTLPGYSPDDFGGVYYLFARGMRPGYPGNGVYFDRPEQRVLEELDDCVGAK